jgi:exopolysaccharide biosynthesis polyprenyl glycosylphosphotransferase
VSRFASTPAVWRVLRLLGDAVATVTAFYAAFLVRIHLPIPFTQFLLPVERLRFFQSEWWVVLGSLLATLYFFGFYDSPGGDGSTGSGSTERTRRLAAASATVALVLAGYYFLADRQFPRSVLLIFVTLDYPLLLGWRSLIDRVYRAPRRRVALIGCGPAAVELATKIGRDERPEVSVEGWVPVPSDSTPEGDPDPVLGPCLGTVETLPALLASGRIDDIIFATETHPWQTRLLDEISAMPSAGSNVLMLPGPIESLIGRMRYRWVDDVPLIEVVRQSEWQARRPVKRLVDLVAGTLLLVLSLPAMLLCALAIKLSGRGPIFYRQRRVGRGGGTFTLWKFRTMRPDAESGTGEVLAEQDDPRLTPVGAWLRRYRLDELPQLIHVLSGAMSLVGPRPERPGFVERYRREVPGYAERFSVRPGLTGLAQTHGDYHSTPGNKLRYDLAYIANWSPWLDLAILLRTVKIVLTSRGV